MTDNYEPLVFDRTPTEIPVTIKDPKTKEDKHYTLREADGGAAIRFRNAGLAATQLKDGKVSGVEGMASVEPLLVSLCLFVNNPGQPDDNRPVSLAMVKSWPSRIQRSLFTKAKEISDLAEEEDDIEELRKQREELDKRIEELEEGTAKNSESTTDGSA